VIGAASAIRHWSLTPRQTLSLSGRISAGQSRLENLVTGGNIRSRVNVDFTGGSLALQHSVTLKRSREPGDLSDLRLAIGGEAGVERTSPDLGPSPLERFSAWVGLVFRNQWGRVRVMFTYLDLGKAR
jgi:hypothetical protein